MKDIITESEFNAYLLLNRDCALTTDYINIHKEADKIIILAEKIKAERATIAMQRKT